VPELLFVKRLREHGERVAIVNECGKPLSYVELADAVDTLAATLAGPARLIIVEFANVPECVIAYLACLREGHPVVLVEPGSTERDNRTSDTYGASSIFRYGEGEWRFETLAPSHSVAPHAELCILLSTSGTTGSPKLVRLSRANIHANAASIASYLGITPSDSAITTLPLYYSYGMSVLNSHLHAGAAVLLTQRSVAEDEFWAFFEREGATSLSGVPFTFDLLERIDFRSRDYPSLRYLAQAGGRLSAERVMLYAQWAKTSAKQVFVMYGQTEASPRMAYVPPDQLAENADCIGIPIPGGNFELIGEDGTPVLKFDQPGELLYRGPNVMMGYAESADDLAKGSGPNELRTGDLACRRANGNYYITGRKSRFSKILGLRISLDEIERWLHSRGWQGIVSGDDKLIVVAVSGSDDSADIKRALVQRFALPPSAVTVLFLDPIPTLPSTKFDYRQVLRLGHEATDNTRSPASSLLDGYREVLGKTDLRPEDSFLDLGGDSVNFVEISLLLESYIGFVPENWEARSIEALEALKHANEASPHASATSATPDARRSKRPGVLHAGLIAVFLLVAGEAALQTRAYITTGRSALNVAKGEATVANNPAFGVRTYRPHIKDDVLGDDREFTTNSLGFRSPEIESTPAPNELRVVVVGASTVAGAYAKTNSTTFPSLLEQKLRRRMPGRPINVINAGIEGYTVRDIDRLLERGIIALRPSLVLVYAGFNDMALICKASAPRPQALRPAPAPSLPSWVLSREIISKNTVSLRQAPVRAGVVDPKKFFPNGYSGSLSNIVTRLNDAGIETVLMTVARAFNATDGEVGKKLATTALFYNHCLDYDGVNKAGNMFNQAIADVATRHNVTLLDFGKKMSRGPKYFVDAAHFTRAGEEMASDIIYEEITNNPTVATRLGLNKSK
jgi:acyl-CoA synthetase (AMP-forming)/AMP-acid ligase II/lysophospholipase L1-like esterase/acyl carrier protein